MASVLGIDVGHFCVKVVVLKTGFRTLQVVTCASRDLPSSLTAVELEEQRFAVLRELLHDSAIRADIVTISIAKGASFRVLSLPTMDPKRLEQVIAFELESEWLTEPGEQVLAHHVIQKDGKNLKLLVSNLDRSSVEMTLRRTLPLGIQPRYIESQALASANLLCSSPRLLAEGASVVLDIGHLYTQLSVVQLTDGAATANVAFARTIPIAGFAITDTIAKFLSLDHAAAENKKYEVSLSDSSVLRNAIAESLRPLLRAVRQTIASYSELFQKQPQHIFLTGGTSKLKGLAEFLENELQIRTTLLENPSSLSVPDSALYNPALGLALAAAKGAVQIDFRKGDFAYRSFALFLTEKLPQLILGSAALVCCVLMSVVFLMHQKKQERQNIEAVFLKETKALFDKSIENVETMKSQMESMAKKAQKKVISGRLMSDLLFDLTDSIKTIDQKFPESSIDIRTLKAQESKIVLEGTVRQPKNKSQSNTGQESYLTSWLEVLKQGKYRCFKDAVIDYQSEALPPRGMDPAAVKALLPGVSFKITVTMECAK